MERRNIERHEERQRKEKPGGIKVMKRQWKEKPIERNIRERKSAVRSEERRRKERPRETTLGKAEKGKTRRG